MTRVTFRLYAELNDHLAAERRFRAFEALVAPGAGVAEALASLGVHVGRVDLVLVDGEPAGAELRLRGGERVAAYPVFESFDVSTLALRPGRPLRKPRFAVAPGLEPLAEALRAAGFEVLPPRREDRPSEPGDPILLTRDPAQPRALGTDRALVLSGADATTQLGELLERLHLR